MSRLFLICALLLAATGCQDRPDRDVQVGRLHLALNDEQRTNWSGDGPRPLATTVWYPASPESAEEEWRAGVFRFGHSALNAAFLDREQRPLIVLSHGTGGSAAQLSWLAEHLVTQGFIVAGVNHHGNTVTEAQQWPAGFVQPWERSRDLSVLIDRLLEHPEIGPRIDRQRIGAAGFSLGGYSVIGLAGVQLPSFESWEQRCNGRPDSPDCRLPPEAEFSLDDIDAMRSSDSAFQAGLERGHEVYRDRRVGAVYAMAPALVSLLSEADAATDGQGMRFVLSEADEQVPLAAASEFIAQALPQASLQVIDKAAHYVFLAPCTLRGKLLAGPLCRDPGGINRREVYAGIGADAAAFFQSSLQRNDYQAIP